MKIYIFCTDQKCIDYFTDHLGTKYIGKGYGYIYDTLSKEYFNLSLSEVYQEIRSLYNDLPVVDSSMESTPKLRSMQYNIKNCKLSSKTLNKENIFFNYVIDDVKKTIDYIKSLPTKKFDLDNLVIEIL